MPVETLTSAPSGVATLSATLASMGRRGGRPGVAPDTSLRLVGHGTDRRRLAAYQRLCGAPVGDVLPHLFPQVLGLSLQMSLMARPDFPLPPAGLVHVENQATVHRTLRAGEPLDLTISAEDLRPHPRGRIVDLVTEVDSDGERVWEGRSTYLHRGDGDPDAPRGTPAPDLPTGFPAAQWRLEGNLGRRYAAVSGDWNPIHVHPLTARAMGFPRAIAHGMWTAARTLAALGPAGSGPSRSHVWFRKPVLLPTRVDLVVDTAGWDQVQGTVVAGLRSSHRPEVGHLVLSLEAG